MNLGSFLGNVTAVAAVRDMLATGRVPGALLFAGPEGVGKRTLAEMLAKGLNCEPRPQDAGFCGECAACRKAEGMLAAAREDWARRRELKDAGRRAEGLVYFDVQLIEPVTRYILTEQIRELRRVAYSSPFELRRRIFIIDQAQSIHWQAVDLLLKVLEEPPETTTLVLICSNAHELRPTLRSRLFRLPFLPVPAPVIEGLLQKDARVPEPERTFVARLAAGSIAKALTLDLAVYLERRRPWLDFLESVTARPGGNWSQLFDAVKRLTEKRDELDETLGIGYCLLRDLAQTLEGREQQVSDPKLLPRLGAWAGKLGLKGIGALKDGLDEAHRLQIRNVNQQLGFETLALEVMEKTG